MILSFNSPGSLIFGRFRGISSRNYPKWMVTPQRQTVVGCRKASFAPRVPFPRPPVCQKAGFAPRGTEAFGTDMLRLVISTVFPKMTINC